MANRFAPEPPGGCGTLNGGEGCACTGGEEDGTPSGAGFPDSAMLVEGRPPPRIGHPGEMQVDRGTGLSIVRVPLFSVTVLPSLGMARERPEEVPPKKGLPSSTWAQFSGQPVQGRHSFHP